MKPFICIALTMGLFTQSALALETEFERETTVPNVHIAILSLTGSAIDPEQKSGLTNFVGEMLLRGTQSKTREQLERAIDQLGATIAVETRSEAIIVRGAVLSRKLPQFLTLLGEILSKPRFDTAEIAKLKAEVTSAILDETSRDPALSARKFSEFLFGSHPYGKPILGRSKDVEEFTAQDIQTQYKRIADASRLVVIGQGDADPTAVSSWGKDLTPVLPKDPSGGLAEITAPTDPQSRQLFIVDKPERTQTQMEIGQVGVTLKDPDFFPLHVANHAFGGPSFQARLMKEIRVQRGWSYGAYSRFRHGLQPRLWNIHLFPASKDTAAALKHTLGMVEKMRADGLTQEEFDFAKKALINGSGFTYNTPKKRMENRVLERSLRLPNGFMKSYAERIESVTLAQANAAMKKFLRPERLTISVLATAKDLKSALQESAGVTDAATRVVPFTD